MTSVITPQEASDKLKECYEETKKIQVELEGRTSNRGGASDFVFYKLQKRKKEVQGDMARISRFLPHDGNDTA